MTEEEAKECRIDKLKKKDYATEIDNTLTYTSMVEAGIDDMVEIDELNRATLLFNLDTRYKKD